MEVLMAKRETKTTKSTQQTEEKQKQEEAFISQHPHLKSKSDVWRTFYMEISKAVSD
jgi:hypothetical protein